MTKATLTWFGRIAIAALALAATACGEGEDRPNVDVIGGGGDGGTGSVTGEPAAPGVVEPKPTDATQVDVVLAEWLIGLRQTSVKAGKIYFLAENRGPEDPHELVIIRSDLAPERLPAVDGKVPEDKVDFIDEIPPYLPGSSASITVDLKPGKYVLICNIAEVEDGKLESHYELGMRTAFTVTQ